jgi:hypothetical protein
MAILPGMVTLQGGANAPRNLIRSFQRICDTHELRVITRHHLRQATATLLKNLGIAARNAQLILGHSRLAVTLEIYTHEAAKHSGRPSERSATRFAARGRPELRELVSKLRCGCSPPAFRLVELSGLEPLTPCLQRWCVVRSGGRLTRSRPKCSVP